MASEDCQESDNEETSSKLSLRQKMSRRRVVSTVGGAALGLGALALLTAPLAHAGDGGADEETEGEGGTTTTGPQTQVVTYQGNDPGGPIQTVPSHVISLSFVPIIVAISTTPWDGNTVFVFTVGSASTAWADQAGAQAIFSQSFVVGNGFDVAALEAAIRGAPLILPTFNINDATKMYTLMALGSGASAPPPQEEDD